MLRKRTIPRSVAHGLGYKKNTNLYNKEKMEEKVIKMVKTIAGEDAVCFIVWSCYILTNRKYLVAVAGSNDYYEVTYNARRSEWYIDRYSKVSNTVIKD